LNDVPPNKAYWTNATVRAALEVHQPFGEHDGFNIGSYQASGYTLEFERIAYRQGDNHE